VTRLSAKMHQKAAIKIKISLYATLRTKRRDFLDRELVTANASSVGQLLAELDLTRDEAAIVFVNGKRAGLESVIQDGDEIKIFPMLGGG
jgi:molybdopterin converting factor small subunit